MFDILSFLAALAFGVYAKQKGRTYGWGALPLLLNAAMHLYTEVGGGGPGEPMRTIYAFAIAGLLYFIGGQAAVAEDRDKKAPEAE